MKTHDSILLPHWREIPESVIIAALPADTIIKKPFDEIAEFL